MSYGDYVEQLTYLLFLKMADERSQPPYNQNASQPSMIPKAYAWPVRLAAMNMMLHGIGSEASVPIVVADALAADPGDRFDIVLANPPFGKKSSTQIEGADGKRSTEKDVIERDDFWARLGNAVDQEGVDLRPAYQQTLHAQDRADEARRSG